MTKEEQRQKWRYASAKHRSTRQEQIKAYGRSYQWKKIGLDITEEDYQVMLENQSGLCGICRRPNGGRRFHVDHNHDTGFIRGLLCHKCNLGIGNLDDSILLLESALKYMKEGPV